MDADASAVTDNPVAVAVNDAVGATLGAVTVTGLVAFAVAPLSSVTVTVTG